MIYSVAIIDDAQADILAIYKYILGNDSVGAADHVFGKIEELCYSLNQLPERGHVPPELARINVTAYLEVHFKPYRIIYEIEGKKVFIHCILDGRRELQDLLERRLLR
ncbi:MAG: type II toxin-antitoxin system RelE/ParE family toxin [Phycisphaerales bacterium]|nr:type II toxin-antitoxin system RelE/ParE family toxin [Phycisphaerales bacterium]